MEIQITQEQVDAVIESIVRKELDNLEVYDDYYDEFRKTVTMQTLSGIIKVKPISAF